MAMTMTRRRRAVMEEEEEDANGDQNNGRINVEDVVPLQIPR